MQPFIFDIKKYALHDGPGIRISVFFKGCPLNCAWCHNPESKLCGEEKLFDKKKCIGCRSCIDVCPDNALTLTDEGILTDKSKCVFCGACTNVCPSKAMEICGKRYKTSDLLKIIKHEKIFFDNSEGGVTFSGGEPLLHFEYLCEILDKCGENGIHRTLDTSLYAPENIVKLITPRTDLFLIDIKHMDSEKHFKYTGVRNDLILSNINLISKLGAKYWIRIPFIEGVNSDMENIEKTVSFLERLPAPPVRIELLPYHSTGIHKNEKLGNKIMGNGFKTPSPDYILSVQNFIDQRIGSTGTPGRGL